MENEFLRSVCLSDVDLIYEWANDPETRMNSFSTNNIPYADHVEWFRKKLASPGTLFYVLRSGSDDVGQIRLELEGDSALISYSIASRFRGRGFGKKIIHLAEEKLEREYPSVHSLVGCVKFANEASQRIFAALGYARSDKDSLIEYTKRIGSSGMKDRTFIIAELSANHNHNLKIALDTVKAAKEAGADAIKLQTYTPDTITLDCDNEYFQIKQGTIWDGTTLYKLYQTAYTPWDWHKELFDYARSLGLEIFSTPFDRTAVDFLASLGNPIFKIASFEITDIPLIEYAASMGKPMIISSGIATLGEIEEAIAACRRSGNNDITILKCTSAYPAPLDESNLRTMQDMKARFGVKVGLSDHCMGDVAVMTAVALGATVIEKHFILDRSVGGPDSSFSMEPKEFAAMVKNVRDVEKCLGSISYELSDKMRNNRKFSRSLFAVKDIKKGDIFTEENIRSIRPGDGISPKYLPLLLGNKSPKDFIAGTPLTEDLLSN